MDVRLQKRAKCPHFAIEIIEEFLAEKQVRDFINVFRLEDLKNK